MDTFFLALTVGLFILCFLQEKEMVENWILGMVGVGLIVYLFVVLVRPEDF